MLWFYEKKQHLNTMLIMLDNNSSWMKKDEFLPRVCFQICRESVRDTAIDFPGSKSDIFYLQMRVKSFIFYRSRRRNLSHKLSDFCLCLRP